MEKPSPSTPTTRQPLPTTRLVLEAIDKFNALPRAEQDRIRVKAKAIAEKSLGMFVHAIGQLPAPRSAKKKVVESFFGEALKPCAKGNDVKAQGTLEAAMLLGTAIVMYQEGLLNEKPPVIEVAQTVPEVDPPK